jgi:hypothetical protein
LHQFGPWVDTLKLARVYKIPSHSHSMTELLHYTNLFKTATKLSGNKDPHEGLFDAMGCLLLLQWLHNGGKAGQAK